MNAPTPEPITLAELQRRLREQDEGALLVPPRILRRVIKKDRGLGGLGLQVPHHDSYVIGRDAALHIASRAELGCPDDRRLPETLVLLASPDPAALARMPPAEVLRKAWRLLYHCRLHCALEALQRDGKLPPEAVRQRIRAIGELEVEEARAVLKQENLLLPPRPADADGDRHDRADRETYAEFACAFLELRAFDPEHLPRWFPSADPARVEHVLAGDVDAAELLGATRLEGAAEAPPPAEPAEQDEAADVEPVAPAPPADLPDRASRAVRRGNQVRAAILLCRAGRAAEAQAQLDGLASRLHHALGGASPVAPAPAEASWRAGLAALLPGAARGGWSIEARMLYDLQKVCVDNERDIFTVDLVEWFVSWFRRPIKRPLPDQPVVLTVKHLRQAVHRLTGARLPAEARAGLSDLLHRALEDAEARLRDRLRPKLTGALDAVGLRPANLAERLAQAKLVEELLDRVVARGFLTISDLRDALARNRLKLPDLRGPVEFFTGDPLLLANRQLAWNLDGVYRRGEIYLRWLQRFSSLFFGNPAGRFLTLYLILPVLGAFLILKGIDGISEELHHLVGALPQAHTFNPVSFAVLSVFLLPLLHWPAFQRGVWAALVWLWRLARAVLWDLPAAVLRTAPVRWLLQSKVYLVFYQYMGKPAAWAVLLPVVLWLCGAQLGVAAGAWAGLTLVSSVLLNSRLGLVVEEAATDRLVRVWQLIRDGLLPGLFRWVLYIFRQLQERVERLLYAVDEWLRFRSGQGSLAFAGKLIFGLVWFWITYIVRFAVNLLIEPQVNPIKHFPVVTVAHKLMLVIVEPLAKALAPKLGWTYARTLGAVGSVIWLIPGIFGFLAWELKENWRLYKANMSPTLDPEVVGEHGERVIHLLRPGFHSGTLPKLFARLRHTHGRAERKAEEGLHHVEQEVGHFVQRELLAYLAASKRWGPSAPVALGRVILGVSRIRLELCCPSLPGDSVLVDLEERSGRLMAGLARTGWIDGLAAARRGTLTAVLAGFYHLAGVDLVREQLAAALPAGTEYDVTREGLLVRPFHAVYDLDHPDAPPRNPAPGLPRCSADLLFRVPPARWADWVATWEHDQGSSIEGGPLARAPLVPPGPAA
jgi:hypothetical protein